jgi:ATP-dependent Clp protease ATP-binding subunit ClpX
MKNNNFDGSKKEDENLDRLTKDLFNWIKTKPTTGSKSPMPNTDYIWPDSHIVHTKKSPEKEEIKEDILNFNLKPKEIKKYLDRFIIKQDEAKKVLSIAICDHYNHIKDCHKNNDNKHYSKQNIVIAGPTGVGKTFLIQSIADLIGVPFVKSDATKFTETGYVGSDVEDLVRQLLNKANGNVKLAEYGIVYLDEIDKITGSTDRMGKDVSGRGVQSNLLKLLEETEVPTKTPWDIQSQIKGLMSGAKGNSAETINTKHILFIVSGAFVGLEEMIKTRSGKYGFKFNKETNSKKLIRKASTQDFVNFGMEPELMSRLPVRVFCEQLNANDLFSILKHSEKSILKQFIQSFNYYDINITFTDDALHEISQQAFSENIGARGLIAILEKCFREYKFELPSSSIKNVLVTKDIIQNPEENLKLVLKKPKYAHNEFYNFEITNYEKSYFKTHRLLIEFDSDIRKQIILHAEKNHTKITQICKNIIKNLECGLNLLKSSPPTEKFVITKEALKNPPSYLENWITKCINKNDTK